MSQVDKSQSDPQSPPSSKGRLKLILLILLVDLLGFTLVVPLLPRYADLAGFSPTRIGMLMSAYPFCQLFAGPILGRLSDRYGRKPVLVASQMGTTISFLILAFTKQFEFMLRAPSSESVAPTQNSGRFSWALNQAFSEQDPMPCDPLGRAR